jgi:histidyl-tRNA synthetase
VLPQEGRRRERVLGVARERFAAYGYGPIVTPTFEETEVFVRGVGTSTDIVRKEMYTFEDRSGRSLTLRPEGTAPVARAFVEHGMHKLPLPVKLSYIAPMFRYEAPQAGRYREHWQVGVEAIGSEDPLLDVEVIALLADIYTRLDVPGISLRLGSMGDAASRGPYRELLVAYLDRFQGDLDPESRDRLRDNPLRLFDSKDPRVQAVMAEAPKLLHHLSPEAQAHRERVREGLDVLGISYVEDPTLVRGFDYYTRTVFEFTCDRLGAQSGIGGGGRYDGLVADLGGPDMPGIGFGAGVERILLALESAASDQETAGVVDVYLAVTEPALRVDLLPVLQALRARDIRCESDVRGDRGMKAMLRHASSLGARVTIIVGPREAEAGMATVRDMTAGDQREIALDEVVDGVERMLA